MSQFDSLTNKTTKAKSIVVRVYESLGGSSEGTLVLDAPWLKVDKVFKADGLENELEELKVRDGGKKVDISLRGFEIATFKVLLKE